MKQVLIRMPEALHDRAKAKASDEGVSLTALVIQAMEREVETVPTLPRERLRYRLQQHGYAAHNPPSPDAPSLEKLQELSRDVRADVSAIMDDERT
jgi:hypothetical protein